MGRWLLDSLEDTVRAVEGEASPRGLTTLAEFGLAAIILSACGHSADWPPAVLDRIGPVYQRPELAHQLLMDPRTIAAHAWLCEGLLMRGGILPLGVAPLLTGLARRGREAVGLYPWATIEALYLHHRIVRASGVAAADEPPLQFSWPRNWQPKEASDVYRLTHAALFLSDFGTWDWRVGRDALTIQGPVLAEALRASVSRCRADQQFDLLGEIALASLCLGRGAAAAPLFATLARAQQADGCISGWRDGQGRAGLSHATLICYLATGLADVYVSSARQFSRPDRAEDFARRGHGSPSGSV